MPHLPPQLAPFSSAQSAQPHTAKLNLASLGGSFWHQAQYSWGEFEVQGKEAACLGSPELLL